MKQLKCRDAGFDCKAVVQGHTVDEVMAQAGSHVQEVHNVAVTAAMADAIAAQVRDA